MRAFLLIPLLAATGCRSASATRERPKGPLEVLGVSIAFAGESRVELKLRLSFDNPEHTVGAATALSWEIWVRRRWFAEGEQSIYQPLLPSGTTEFDVALPIALRRAPVLPGTTHVDLFVRGELSSAIGSSEEQTPFQRMLRASAPASPLWETGVEED